MATAAEQHDHEKLTPGDLSSSDRSEGLGSELNEEGSTLYDRKCLLINREIDAMGMGRYQWCLWSLCGFGYMIDLMWAQAFGLVLSPLQQELGFGDGQTGNLSTAFSAGLTAGAFVWGVLVDVIGRQWAFNLTVFIASAFGLCIGAPSTYDAILVLTAFTGFGVGGNIPIDTTITLEFTPQSRRYLLPLLSVFQPLGVVICSAIAYGFIPKYSCSPNFSEQNPLPSCNNVGPGTECCTKASNMGWRYLLFTLGGITLLVFFLRFVIFRFQESPKFLLYRGRDDKAIQVLHNVAKFNKRTCSLTLEHLEALERDFDSIHSGNSIKPMLGGGAKQLQTTWMEKIKLEGDRFKILFSSVQMTRLTLLVWLTYICDYWGFTVAGSFLPKILAAKNGALHLSLKYTYRSYIYIYLPGIVGVLLGAASYQVSRVGRKWTMVISSAMMGVSIFLFSSVNSAASNIGFNVMEYFFQSMFNAVLYGWTPEAFPAPIRGTACGIASFWGRLFGIVSPLIAQHLYASSGGGANSVLYLAGGVSLGCVVTTALLPSKLVGRQSM
ncbi:MFS general substrate transporter [Phaeosphaeriaceae sp. SRC1lsM3a]|nr:MFS general substrate transporter [Stagonospora sp. SRC1lsM3a]